MVAVILKSVSTSVSRHIKRLEILSTKYFQQRKQLLIFSIIIFYLLYTIIDKSNQIRQLKHTLKHEIIQELLLQQRQKTTITTTLSDGSVVSNNPLQIPMGYIENLPSIRKDTATTTTTTTTTSANVKNTTTTNDNTNDNSNNNNENGVTDIIDQKRDIYGGKGDKAHLGGFTTIDIHGISPSVWKYMLSDLNIHSIMDVGCGRGISTLWFHLHNVSVLCVEGSHDAVINTVLPILPTTNTTTTTSKTTATKSNNKHDANDSANLNTKNSLIVEHDYSRGPWWPADRTYDAVWCVEFLEHVGIQYHSNYIQTFRKAAIIFVTSSLWGGWHHVEVHNDAWWITKYEAYGFRYNPELTARIKQIALDEAHDGRPTNIAPNGEQYNAQHIHLNVKVFINPMVAALPQHVHLFFEHGCYGLNRTADMKLQDIVHRICGTGHDDNAIIETPLPREYWPIPITPEMDTAWYTTIQSKITTPTT